MDDDLVATWWDDGGSPRRFEWRGRMWQVAGHPVPWIERVPWWTSWSQPVVATAQKMWRVVGLDAASGETVTVDLAVAEAGWCRLAGVCG